ncbi:MAG: squalene--hopene cyclase, partial [Alphaproteobacteria bacterium]
MQGEALDALIKDAREALLARQREDGHWVYELEADATIPAEYIMLLHYLGEEAPETEARLANYLRAIQGDDGGWPLFHAGEMDLSATVKAYFALKLAGDDPSAAHMARAREVILAAGGAARANVFTRIALALFGEVPWRAVPVMPVEIMLLPRWFPFHLEKVSYWSRTVIVPLLILMALKPRARNPGDIHIRELFATPPDEERHYLRSATDRPLARLFLGLDRLLRLAEPHMPTRPRARAIEAALNFTRERLNGEDGLGAIFPAMANAVMAFEALGYAPDHPDRAIARQAIDKLLVFHDDWGYCQPCVSPIWDTALAAHALMESGVEPEQPEMQSALSWLRDLQILDVKGDWTARRPDLRPGGWAFQYRNDFYPDVDDSAVVGMALDRAVR